MSILSQTVTFDAFDDFPQIPEIHAQPYRGHQDEVLEELFQFGGNVKVDKNVLASLHEVVDVVVFSIFEQLLQLSAFDKEIENSTELLLEFRVSVKIATKCGLSINDGVIGKGVDTEAFD